MIMDEKLLAKIKIELNKGALVLLIGSVNKGKTLLINQLSDGNYVVFDENTRRPLRKSEMWSVRTASVVAIDEVQLFGENELLDVSEIVVSCSKGMIVSIQDRSVISESVVDYFIASSKRVIEVDLSQEADFMVKQVA